MFRLGRGKTAVNNPNLKNQAFLLTAIAVAGLPLLSVAPNVAAQGAAPTFGDPAFRTTWARTDALVANQTVTRSWYWGPQPNTPALHEDYLQGPDGKHLVQYFDKSRMEINNPGADPSNPFYVTNGLLAYELITGQMQTGDNQYTARWPAEIPIAGDTNVNRWVEPTYASFRSAVAHADAPAVGKLVNAIIYPTGTLDFEHGSAAYLNYDKYTVKNAHYETATNHNIPDVFWTYVNSAGPIVVGGKTVHGTLSDPYFYVTGYPVSDAYWSQILISGQEHSALIQAFQRRVLTYVPDLPAAWRVQMGNVGQHYYDWRYKDAGKSPALAGACPPNGAPTLGFGKLYNSDTSVKQALGCQQDGEQRSTIAYQPFEHGAMLAQTRFDFYSGMTYEDIFALFDSGKAVTYAYITTRPLFEELSGANPPTPVPGTPLPTPPAGKYAPEGNFAGLWLSGDMRAKLGWGTGSVQVNRTVKDSTGAVQPGTGGAIQFFEGGEMVYAGVPALNKKILVLYNTGGYAYVSQGPHLTKVDIDSWRVYNDTFQP
jgi:hypothetical protein